MNNLRKFALVSTVIMLGFTVGSQRPAEVHAYTLAATGDRVLTGELVVTNAARNQFRIVGYGGSFAAPPGTPVEALDGKPVEVELARNGRVLGISEMPVHFEPHPHTYEVVSGELLVRDRALRTFSIAGDDRIYLAPAGSDVGLYAGRMVEVRLDEQGQVATVELASRSVRAPVVSSCSSSGLSYADGTSLCQSGVKFVCEQGQWRNLGTACASADAMLPASPHTCMVGSATVAAGSSICRAGTTFRCTDGEWVKVGRACS
jgi:hypothetical protein